LATIITLSTLKKEKPSRLKNNENFQKKSHNISKLQFDGIIKDDIVYRFLALLRKVIMTPPIAIIMGSTSDWPTMKHAANILDALSISYDSKVISAHRTPERLYDFSRSAEEAGYKIIIAGAGGAAHLPGMTASMTALPVLGVPVESKALSGMDSLLSIAQMPGGVPVGTLAIGNSGAKNAALLATSILALSDKTIAKALKDWRKTQTDAVALYPAK